MLMTILCLEKPSLVSYFHLTQHPSSCSLLCLHLKSSLWEHWLVLRVMEYCHIWQNNSLIFLFFVCTPCIYSDILHTIKLPFAKHPFLFPSFSIPGYYLPSVFLSEPAFEQCSPLSKHQMREYLADKWFKSPSRVQIYRIRSGGSWWYYLIWVQSTYYKFD